MRRTGRRCTTRLISLLPTIVLTAAPIARGGEGSAAGRPPQQAQPAQATPVERTQAPLAPCPLPAGEPVAAEAILRDLREGRDVDLHGRVIEGSLDADQGWGRADDRRVSLRVVAGSLRLDSCRITGGISFPRTIIEGDLDMSCTEVRGDLDLADGEVHGALNAGRARILGEGRLARLFVPEGFSFDGASFGGRLDLSGLRSTGALLAAGLEVGRDLEATHLVVGELDLSSARVAGQGRIQDLLALQSLNAQGAVFSQGLSIDGLRSVGTAELGGISLPAGASLTDSRFEADLVFSPTAQGAVSLAGVEVGKGLQLRGGALGALTLERVRVGGESNLDELVVAGTLVVRECEFGLAFHARGALFRGESELRKSRFPGADPFEGALFGKAPVLIDTVLPRPPEVLEEEEETPGEEGDGGQGEGE